jgi:hypothetical protein
VQSHSGAVSQAIQCNQNAGLDLKWPRDRLSPVSVDVT